MYSSRYLETSGQIYWADWQLSAAYVDDYHADLDRALGARVKATEMITEIYVPRHRLAAFMEDARAALAARRANVIYGTVRLIEKDDETFLAWASSRYACVIFNLHVEHTSDGHRSGGRRISRADRSWDQARRELLPDLSPVGPKDQIERCYPQLREFLALKRQYDPEEVFQSTWYRHYRTMFA